MALELTDDGTMDTVLRCSDCGQEMRYNYDGPPSDLEDNPPEGWEDCGQCECWHPLGFTGDCRDDVNRWPSKHCIERLNEQAYQAFIDWAIEDATAEHKCEPTAEGE